MLVVGGGPFSDGEQQRLPDLQVARRVHRIDATDGLLPSIFSGALAFIFPSRYEGFGLPTLEAGPAVFLSSCLARRRTRRRAVIPHGISGRATSRRWPWCCRGCWGTICCG